MRSIRSLVIVPKYRFVSIAAFFLVVFSGCFLTRILPLSPIYFAVLLAVFNLFIAVSYQKMPRDKIFIYIPCFLLVLYFCGSIIITQINVKDTIVLIFFTSFYILVDLVLYQTTKKELNVIINYYFVFNIILFSIDFIVRLIMAKNTEIPNWIKAKPVYSFYLYKENTIMFEDTNAGSIIILSILSVLTFIKRENIYKNKYSIEFILLIFLLVSNFSRAAIISYFILLLYIVFIYKKNILQKMIMFFPFLILFFFITIYAINDPGFFQRILIFKNVYRYIKEAGLFPLLFGNGTNSSPYIIGRSAHNLYFVYLIEYGLIGLILFLLHFILLIIDTGKYALFIAIPYFIAAVSYSPIVIPFIYCSFLLIKYTSKYK